MGLYKAASSRVRPSIETVVVELAVLLEVVMLVTLVVLAKVDADTEEVVIVVVVVLRSLPIHSFHPDFWTERSLRQTIALLGVTPTGPFSPV